MSCNITKLKETLSKNEFQFEIINKEADRYLESYKTRSKEVQQAVRCAFINGAKTNNRLMNK